MSAGWGTARTVQLDVDCPVCEVQALTGQRTPHGPCSSRGTAVRRRRKPPMEITNRGALLLCLLAWTFFMACFLYGLHK